MQSPAHELSESLADSQDNYHIDEESVTSPRVDDKMTRKQVPLPSPTRPVYSLEVDVWKKVHRLLCHLFHNMNGR